MKRSGLIAFYGLTFAATWGFAAAVLISPAFARQFVALFGPVTLWNPVVFLLIWSPTIFALILALVCDGVAGLREFLSRIFRWRIGLRWYLVSTAGVAALALAARFVQAHFTHTPAPPVLDLASWPHLMWYGATMLFLDPGPIGEDPGWRGFALPRMVNEFNPAIAAILLGVIWAIFHLPAFFFSGMPQSQLPLGWFLLATTSMTVVLSWVSLGTRGAVIPAILVHWAANRFNDLGPDGAMYCAIAWTLAAVVLIAATRGQLGLPPGSDRAVRGDKRKLAVQAA